MSSAVLPFEGKAPRIAPSAFVAPTAIVIGDVEIGEESSVWFQCVLRGDDNFIRVGRRSNLQDGTVVHISSRDFPTLIGDDVTVGHAALIHACTLMDHAFVGMGATVLDGAVIEPGGVLAAGALLVGKKVIGRNELWQGTPARLVRVLSAEERDQFAANAAHYVTLAARFRVALAASAQT